MAKENQAGIRDEIETEDLSCDQEPIKTPLTQYIYEINQIPLLTTQEELGLAQTIEQGKTATQSLQQPGLSAAEMQKLNEIAEKGEQARKSLIEANLRLVVSIAKRYRYPKMSPLDLIQEGNIGLSRAIEKFDWRRGYKLSTYATWWIRQTITRAIAEQARTIRQPVHIIEVLNKLSKAELKAQQRLGREPTAQELAEETNLPVQKIYDLLVTDQQPVSLQSPANNDSNEELWNFIPDQSVEDPEEQAYHAFLQSHLNELLEKYLSAREGAVMRLRFGLGGTKQMTLEEVGQELGVSRERIRQIEQEALRKLKQPDAIRQLTGYLDGVKRKAS